MGMVFLSFILICMVVFFFFLLILGVLDDCFVLGKLFMFGIIIVFDGGEFVFGFFVLFNFILEKFYIGMWYNNVFWFIVVWVVNWVVLVIFFFVFLFVFINDFNFVLFDVNGCVFWKINIMVVGIGSLLLLLSMVNVIGFVVVFLNLGNFILWLLIGIMVW